MESGGFAYMTSVEGENTRRHYERTVLVKLCVTRVSALDVEMFALFAASLLEVSDSSSTSWRSLPFQQRWNCFNWSLTLHLFLGSAGLLPTNTADLGRNQSC